MYWLGWSRLYALWFAIQILLQCGYVFYVSFCLLRWMCYVFFMDFLSGFSKEEIWKNAKFAKICVHSEVMLFLLQLFWILNSEWFIGFWGGCWNLNKISIRNLIATGIRWSCFLHVVLPSMLKCELHDFKSF
jgi:hypothetical protein